MLLCLGSLLDIDSDLYGFLIPLCATHPAHLILFDLKTVIFAEE